MRAMRPSLIQIPVSPSEPSLPWLPIWFSILLAGGLYILGQHESAGAYERSVQRQYDLMQVERQSILDGARRSLEREGLHVEGEAK